MPTDEEIDAAAAILAESSNGGRFDDPAFYAPQHRERWRQVARAHLAVGKPLPAKPKPLPRKPEKAVQKTGSNPLAAAMVAAGNAMAKDLTFDEAMKAAGGKDCLLLLGNGFSARYFSYRSLLEKADLKPDDPVRILFDRLKTVDFERVVKALEGAAEVEQAYGNTKHADDLTKDANRLREALVHAIRGTHPGHREDIADVIPSCEAFLTLFEEIFTLNYDLLLYWVSLADEVRLPDGFGLGEKRGGFQGPFKTDAYCNTYNLHGGLHLFRDGTDIQKRLDTGSGVIDAIAHTIVDQKRFPLYVAEGTSPAKMARIKASDYLSHCYDKLGKSTGSFFVFGHSADPNDAHIYDAIFKSGIGHLYFCVYRPTDDKIKAISGELARYKERAGSKIPYTFVDSESCHVWDKPPPEPKDAKGAAAKSK